MAQILYRYGVREPVLHRVVNEITSDREQWVEFMMRNELGLERPDEQAAPRSAALVGGGYVLGGIFPLAPYAFVPDSHQALWWSIALHLGRADRVRRGARARAPDAARRRRAAVLADRRGRRRRRLRPRPPGVALTVHGLYNPSIAMAGVG